MYITLDVRQTTGLQGTAGAAHMVSGMQCECVCVRERQREFTLCVDSETVLPGGTLGGAG